MGGNDEALQLDLNRLCLLLEAHTDIESELKAANQVPLHHLWVTTFANDVALLLLSKVLQNELTNLRGVLQTLKLAPQFDLQKKKVGLTFAFFLSSINDLSHRQTEEKLERMLSEIQSSDSSLQAAVSVRNDLLVPIQKLTSSIKV